MVDAALREAEEEVGLRASDVEVVGWLDRVAVATSGATVTPIVGVLVRGRPEFVPAPAEVEDVFDVGLSELAACYWQERWDVPAPDRAMHFFDLGEDVVWGMTARVLYDLLASLTERTALERTRPPARA